MKPVRRTDRALDRLADLYTAADPAERERIAAATEGANTTLRYDSADSGESRGGQERVAFFGRLTVYFIPARGTDPAEVIAIRWRPRHSS